MAEVKVEERDYIVYNFKWKEVKGEWQTEEVVGHKFFKESNRMVLHKVDGGIFEIPSWNEHYSELGADWAEVMGFREDKNIKDLNKIKTRKKYESKRHN